jgi:S-DNA-T family DNA segregation ATPase FtsK/SpoIIIE
MGTQKPDYKTIDTRLRDLFGSRIAFRSATREASEIILGDAGKGWDASSIPKGKLTEEYADEFAGIGILINDEVPEMIRTFCPTDQDIEQIVERAKEIRLNAWRAEQAPSSSSSA